MAGGTGAGAQATQSASPTTQGSGFGMSTPSTMPTSSFNQQMPAFLQNRVAGTGQPLPGQFGYGGSDTFAYANRAEGAIPPAQLQAQRGFSPAAQQAMMQHREMLARLRTPTPPPVQPAPVQQAPRQRYVPTAADRAEWAQQTQERANREESARQAGLRSIEGLGLNFNDPLAARSNVAASVPLAQQNMTLAQRKAFENEARRLR